MKKFVILIPVYNDWESVTQLLENIDLQIKEWDAEVSVLIVNDSSTKKRLKNFFNYKKIKSIKVINMKKNRGHARCNAAGLKYLTENDDYDYVVLMDGDGEDRPEELPSLLRKSQENPTKVITADRIKRSEGPFFKILYEFHKILTYFFTGKLIKFGNYSCLPKEQVVRLTRESCLWSSFSGSLTKIVKDRASVPSIRGARYFGPSQMNFFSLLIHSFSIMAVFKKTVIIRSILYSIVYLFFIYGNFSFATLIPFFFLSVFLFLILKTSSRENIEELNNSLKNIESIDLLNISNNG